MTTSIVNTLSRCFSITFLRSKMMEGWIFSCKAWTTNVWKNRQSPSIQTKPYPRKGFRKKPGKVWTFAVPPCCSHWWPPVLRPYLVHLTTNMIMWSYTRWKIMMRTVHIAKNHFVKLLIWGVTGAFSRVVSSHHLDTTLACQIFLSIDTFELTKYKTLFCTF